MPLAITTEELHQSLNRLAINTKPVDTKALPIHLITPSIILYIDGGITHLPPAHPSNVLGILIGLLKIYSNDFKAGLPSFSTQTSCAQVARAFKAPFTGSSLLNAFSREDVNFFTKSVSFEVESDIALSVVSFGPLPRIAPRPLLLVSFSLIFLARNLLTSGRSLKALS